MLPSLVVDILMACPDVRVLALVRNVDKSNVRFHAYLHDPRLRICVTDLTQKIQLAEKPDYILHGASIPRPDNHVPVDVLSMNVLGTWNLCEWAAQNADFSRFIYFGSAACYGECNLPPLVSENCPSRFPSLDVHAGYGLSKAMAENIGVSFMRQYGVSFVSCRFVHSIGPFMDLEKDPRSFVDFFRCALAHRPIVLRSSGKQQRQWLYASDALAALFYCMFKGQSGTAYNVAGHERLSIKTVAELIANAATPHVPVTTLIEACERNTVGYSPTQIPFDTIYDTHKIESLGWRQEIFGINIFRRVLLALQ